MLTVKANTGGRPRVLGPLAVLLAWLFAVLAIIATDRFASSRAAQDQDNYHLRAVRTFAEQWPRADLRDYRSATTPGYHLLLAEVQRLVSPDPRLLRVAGALFGLGLLVTLAVAARRLPGLAGASLVLPLACSLYVFSAAAWLLPDNAGWWGVLAIGTLTLARRPTTPAILTGGAVLLLLVLCRQIHLWAAGPLWAWALLGGPGERPDPKTRARRLGLALIAAAPAFGAVFAFARLWHGLVPPLFQGGVFDPVVGKLSPQNTGPNPATPAFLLALFGCYGVFFAGFFHAGIARLVRRERGALLAVTLSVVAAAACALAPVSTFDAEAGRYTGFWALVRRLPVIADRSVFIVGAAAVGGAVLGLCLASLRRREAALLLVTVLAFAAAQTTAFAAWQRYLEPMVLLTLALGAIAAHRAGDERTLGAEGAPGPAWERGLERGAPAGPALLGVALAAVTLASLRAGSAGLG